MSLFEWDNLPEVPAAISHITGYDSIILDITGRFFDSVLDWLGFDRDSAPVFCRQEYYLLRRSDQDQGSWIQEKVTLFPGEEQYAVLLIVNNAIAASVIVRRDDFNNCQAGFASYLSPEWVEQRMQPPGEG